MKNLKATCKTDSCPQKDITHEFNSDVLYTVCGICNQEVTDLVITDLPEEVTDGTPEETE